MRLGKIVPWILTLSVVGFVVAFPQSASAAIGGAPWETALQTVVDFLTGSTARLVAIIAVAGVGFLSMTGRITAHMAISVIVGIAVVFGSATIVDLFAR